MTNKERALIGKQISNIIKTHKTTAWQDLKEQIVEDGYQPFYHTQEEFVLPIKSLINNLTNEEKQELVNEWKQQTSRIQFTEDEDYLTQYKVYLMEEIVSRASKATYYM